MLISLVQEFNEGGKLKETAYRAGTIVPEEGVRSACAACCRCSVE